MDAGESVGTGAGVPDAGLFVAVVRGAVFDPGVGEWIVGGVAGAGESSLVGCEGGAGEGAEDIEGGGEGKWVGSGRVVSAGDGD